MRMRMLYMIYRHTVDGAESGMLTAWVRIHRRARYCPTTTRNAAVNVVGMRLCSRVNNTCWRIVWQPSFSSSSRYRGGRGKGHICYWGMGL